MQNDGRYPVCCAFARRCGDAYTGAYLRSAQVSRLMTRRWGTPVVLIAACAVSLIAGCGSSSRQTSAAEPTASQTDAPATQSTVAASGAASSTPAVTTPAGPSFSGETTFKANNFSLRLDVNVALGTVSTNTQGMTPPAVNVVVPVSGSATLTNITAGYTAEGEEDIPRLSIWALYKSCGVGESEVGVTELCGVEIAGVASTCSSSTNAEGASAPEVSSLAPGQSGTLALWPIGPNQLDPAQMVGGVPCETMREVRPADDFTLANMDPSERQTATAALSSEPSYWVVLGTVVDHECYERGLQTVIVSRPAGLPVCLESDTPKA
jgi:hypothetical protein